jgi:hypothetical protein
VFMRGEKAAGQREKSAVSKQRFFMFHLLLP